MLNLNRKAIFVFIRKYNLVLLWFFILSGVFFILYALNFIDERIVCGIQASFIQQIGLGIMTFLIPFWIDFLGKSYKGETNFKDLDISILMNKIFNYKKVIFYFSVLMIFPVFLDIHFNFHILEIYFKMIVIIVSIVSVINLIKIVTLYFKFMNFDGKTENISFLDQQRLNFCDEIGEYNTFMLEKCWRSVWASKKMQWAMEQKFLNLFIKKIKEYINNKDFKTVSVLLRVFLDDAISIDNRNYAFFSKRTIADLLFLWRDLFTKDNAHLEYDFSFIMGEINVKIRDIVLCDKIYSSYYPFIDAYGELFNRSLTKKDYEFLSFELFPRVFDDKFFEISSENYDFWEEFKWKITKVDIFYKKEKNDIKYNIKDIKNLFFMEYLNFIKRILFPKKGDGEINLVAESVSMRLFPDFDPIYWSRILYMIMLPYNPENRMKSIIMHKKLFGIIGRPITGFVNDNDFHPDKIEEEYVNNTIEYSLKQFNRFINEEFLSKSKQELVSIKQEFSVNNDNYGEFTKYEDIIGRLLAELNKGKK